MRISRFRLRLVAAFGAALAIGLVILSLTLFTLVHRESSEVLTEELHRSAQDLAAGMRWEMHEEPGGDLASQARDAIGERPHGADLLLILDLHGGTLAARDEGRLPSLPELGEPGSPTGFTVRDLPDTRGGAVRLVALQQAGESFRVVVGRSLRDLRSESRELAAWLGIGVPLVAGLSLLGGYVLANRAMAPVRALAGAIDGIEVHALGERLPVRAPHDEIDELADRFNRLLDRVEAARDRNRRFLAEAAHQIRTPLTLVRGESGLALERTRDATEYRTSLGRIQRAADQMSRRVDDLFLLARAEAGERPSVNETVELDVLALEVTDLMRGRAAEVRGTLELDHIEAVETLGNSSLLREALTELLENAIRYGAASEPIRVSAFTIGLVARLEVSSAGPCAPTLPRPSPEPVAGSSSTGLGLSIVQWIAALHQGDLHHDHDGRRNVYRVQWPHRPLADRAS